MTSPCPSRVAALHLEARTSVREDIFARARILEAAAGRPKWSLSGNEAVFMTEGPAQFPDVDPDWFSRRDQGLAKAVESGARKILGDVATGEATAEELVQNMISGLSISGGSRADVYEDAAKMFGREILAGKTKPKQVKTTLFGFAQSRALDVWRKKMRHKKEREKSNPHLVGPQSLREVPAEVALDRSPTEVMLSLISGPMGRKFRNWIYKTVKRKATDVQNIIIDLSMDYLQRTGEWPSANSIRDDVIEAKGSGISVRKINDHRKKVEELIAKEMKGDPQVLDWADRYIDLAQLGYGGGQLRAARRVASRFLLGRSYTPSRDEQADLDIKRWQKDVGMAAASALKRLPEVKAVQRPSVNRDGAVMVNMTIAPPINYSWDDLDKYDKMEIVESREMRFIDYLEKALKTFMGSGRAHESYGGFYLTKDYIFGSSKNGTDWEIQIHPHLGR